VQSIQVACQACGQPVTIEVSPNHRIVNMATVSILIVEHSSQTLCPSCRAVVMPVMRGVAGVLLEAKVVPAQEQQSVIIPGA
jgi:hypothetical protein